MRLPLLIASALALAACAAPDSSPNGNGHAAGGTTNNASSARVAAATTHARLAGLPDRGQLLAYASAAGQVRGAYTFHEATLSEEHALLAITDGTLEMQAPDGTPIRLRYDHHVEHPNGDWTWVGRPQGAQPGTEAIITFGDKAVFGTIPNGRKQPLRITSVAGRSYVMETDSLKLAGLRSVGNRPTGPDMLVPPVLAGARDRALAQAAEQPQQLTASGAVPETAVVDVAMGYTNGFASRLGGKSQAVTRLNHLVDVANQAFTNSHVVARLRLVSTVQVTYPDDTNNETALRALTGVECTETSNGNLDCHDAPVPAALQPLVTARANSRADVMSLVRNFSDPENESCGIAWLLGGGQTPIVSADAYAAVSVVSDSSGNLYPDNNYVCRNETFAHEVAHNMGSAHDVVTARGGDNTLQEEEYGRYPYSFGYKTSSGNFYTIMAYGDDGQTPYRVFSNPGITYCGGLACGVSSADNAKSLGRTVPVIASFHASIAPRAHVHNDIDGDGKSDAILQRPGSLAYLIMSGNAIVRSRSFTVTGDWRVVGTGDFDNNGRTDILFLNAARELFVWMGDGSAFASTRLMQVGTGYAVIGTGDIDADGNDDIVLHRPGQIVQLYMDGARVARSSNVADDGMTPAVGDFDGNGRADLAMLKSNGEVHVWLSTSTGYSKAFVTTIKTAFSIKAVHDIDADGDADLLLFRPGQLVQYFMEGQAVVRSRTFTVTSTYSLPATGDFNGDGRGDVMLQHNTYRSIYLWLATTTAYTSSSSLYTPATGYTVVR